MLKLNKFNIDLNQKTTKLLREKGLFKGYDSPSVNSLLFPVAIE